ncbi:hypothetical protein C1637_19530 [Chryseobacterium lactis]|uniref:Peptidase M43 pregnancy-associated plasma-A domain-containing protein n=1 Tax=Chryseobacterium lactis TaxID=1241981 RepID=A0A3G6REQ7_CHRLC|nr:hypothetical protein [Chryseobacterium lactis]AZA83158.1 hypothetical protein EG342_15295 [Chryseobacterium lactis]AZB03542.1 hypothetical protein EG341_06165 [Chryseobacterium lactis]PNW11952.1 hypothetical protein C1637_19530 [Chryseobacterium lactis]
MKRIVFLFSMMIMFLCWGQNIVDNRLNFRTAGSAYRLKGKILQVNFFVSCPGYPVWTMDQKNEIMELLPEGTGWLKKEAARYGQPIDFKFKNYGYKTDIISNSTPHDVDNPFWQNDLIKQLGYPSMMDFYNELKRNNDFDQVYVVFFINREGVSYANLTDRDYVKENKDSFLETAILFNQFEGKSLVGKGERYTLPHEILHLFGALDLYEGDDQSAYSEDVAIQKIPNSIMLGSVRFLDEDEPQYELPEYKIDEFTAYFLSLHHEYKKWYKTLSNKCKTENSE